VDPEVLARYLRQRQEMGQGPVYLESLSRAEALASSNVTRGPIPTSQRPDAGAIVKPGEAVKARAGSGDGVGTAGRSGASATRPASGDAAAGARARTSREASSAATVGAPSGGVPLPVLTGDLEEIRATALACVRCRLHTGRTQAVFADGNPNARLMVVGEAPGEQEDRTGRPFVGPAGKLLDLMLASVGLSRRDSVYICNVIKCRPPGNRNPLPDEIETCAPYLRRQIELVKPEALLAVGTFSGKLLTRSDRPLGKLRGEVYSYEGVPLVITYHPAALLRNQGWSRAAWDDLQLLRQVMDG
jgi:DNA polymerase